MDAYTMFTKFYRPAYADVRSGNVDIRKELERAMRTIKMASRCGFVYSGISCITCCLCFVKPCCLIAFDENYRYKVLKKNVLKCEEIYGEDWKDAKKMNDLFVRAMEVIEAALFRLQSRRQWLEDTKRRREREYETNPADLSLLNEINDIKCQLTQILFMSMDDNEFVHCLLLHVLRHHNPNTDLLGSNFPITITHYDMTILRATIPFMCLAFEKRNLLKIDEIIEIDTRAAYQLLSI